MALEILDLGNNHLKDTFPISLGALLKLQVLALSSNRLYVELGGSTMPSSQFPKLRIIDLSNNDFTGYLEYFQQWNAVEITLVEPLEYMALITNLATIEVLGILWQGSYEHSMTLTNKGVRTEYVKILDILIAIDLSSNKFMGGIPESIGSLKGIQSLNLSNNDISGHIPLYLGNLAMLESLDISGNKLSGQIPAELSQLSFLALLNVSLNYLSGSIPQGKQFNTFLNSSSEETLALCGDPLSLRCGSSKAPVPSTIEEKDDLEFLSRTEWIVMFTAIGGGLVLDRFSDKFYLPRMINGLLTDLGRRQRVGNLLWNWVP